MTRGLKTVWHHRTLLNPFRFGVHSWMVLSHKLCRWLVPAALLLGTGAVVGLAALDARAVPLAAAAAILALLAGAGWLWPEEASVPKLFAVPAYVVVANLAALNGWVNLLLGKSSAAWSPTRR